MLPLMKVARLAVAALMSSWALEIHSFAISSSRTFWLFLFSLVDMLAVEADASVIAGIMERKEEGEAAAKVGWMNFLSGMR